MKQNVILKLKVKYNSPRTDISQKSSHIPNECVICEHSWTLIIFTVTCGTQVKCHCYLFLQESDTEDSLIGYYIPEIRCKTYK